MPPPIEDRAQLGIAMTLVAWFLFSIVDTSAKWLVLLGLPFIQLAFMRYFGHFVISTALIFRTGIRWDVLRTDHFWLVMLRAFCLVSATLSLIHI